MCTGKRPSNRWLVEGEGGEAVRNYDLWTAEGMAYDKLILKLKEYRRNKKPDGKARKGKQAVDFGEVQDWSDKVPANEGQEERASAETEELNVLCRVKCYIRHKNGHAITNCPSRQGKAKGKDKSKCKGTPGKGGKSDRGAAKGKATGPKGGCWNCGGNRYADHCPSMLQSSFNL